ncbi:D-amino acid dehydrogenase small subunit [Thalassovita gelatinovora]|uniref:D-amino acid dehydrogenase small subunit n=1 Tax=Thalassovita gelatinovora TaxID=53501 RepID=A0A0P1FIF4_THAGE|nr:FAD-binding oxidoreductase [Thalassovita gelatinovora]QIZ82071.1 FAD-binding oxidoreductase [Thalassovita gelatinovora]CUH67598.1 D-amino acid dehydrogenase small subunit [Thalassovita gelatinovora]SEP71120.1 D-amino-acid dehydrogenase [Thalassovita gelatinovora]
MAQHSKRVIIVGAGIIGVAAAVWLQREGHQVVLVDRAGPAEGASFGNGGVLASCAIVPVTTPGLWTEAPGMVLNPQSPLFLRWSYLPRMMPWLLRYLGHATDRGVQRTAKALYPIIGDSLSDHQTLAAGTGAEKWIIGSDYVYLYPSRRAYLADHYGWKIKRQFGFDPVEYEGEALRAYDPSFGQGIGFGAALPGHGRITDPGQYVKDLAAHVVAQGGELRRADVSGLIRDGDRVTGVQTDAGPLHGDAVLIATGAWSGPLARELGLNIPLETERGYHIELWNPSIMPKAPVMMTSGSFVITPMEGRLRLAGIVEFGGLQAGPSRAPFNLLRKHLKTAMPDLRWDQATEWMGHRPTLTDSVPVIGAVPGWSGAYLGFGHHHVGLTGGAKTGQLLAQMITGKHPNIDMAPYDPGRFAG